MKRINYELHSTNYSIIVKNLPHLNMTFCGMPNVCINLSLSWRRYLTHIMQLVCGEVTEGSQFKGKKQNKKQQSVLARCRVTNPDSSFNGSWHRVSP